MNAEEWPAGTRVRKPGYGYTGSVVGYVTKHRTRWCEVAWQGRPYTAREYPHAIERVTE